MVERRGAKGSTAWIVGSGGGSFAMALAALFAVEHLPSGSESDAVRSALARQYEEVATDQPVALDPALAALSRSDLGDLVTNAPNLRGIAGDGPAHLRPSGRAV